MVEVKNSSEVLALSSYQKEKTSLQFSPLYLTFLSSNENILFLLILASTYDIILIC